MNNQHQNARLTVYSREQILARVGEGQSAAEVAGGGMSQTTPMHHFADASAIDQAEARLDRIRHGTP